MFRGTIRENLLLAKPSATQRELDTVIDVAQLKLTLQRLSRRLDHTLDAGATGLSGGEQQRLAIARALLRPSAVLILDEASSALDLPTDIAMYAASPAVQAGDDADCDFPSSKVSYVGRSLCSFGERVNLSARRPFEVAARERSLSRPYRVGFCRRRLHIRGVQDGRL